MSAEFEWANAFGSIARELSQIQGLQPTLTRIAELATIVAACPWAAVARATDQHPVTAAVNDPTSAERIAHIQSLGGGGPTWDSVARAETIHVPDLAREDRWPEHVRLLLTTTPVRSILAFCLQLDGPPLGALTLYSDRAEAFPERVVVAATVYADHAAIALDHEQTEERADHLTAALQSSREIGVAIGILVERYKITPDAAFDMLRTSSQRSHRKLRDVAIDLVFTGSLPA